MFSFDVNDFKIMQNIRKNISVQQKEVLKKKAKIEDGENDRKPW